MIQDPEAARLGLLVDYAMDMYTGPMGRATLEPPPDPRLAPDWALRSYVCGTDAVLHLKNPLALGQDNVCYGFLAESSARPGAFVAVIRGTDGILEWVEDGEFVPVRCPAGGMVEQGFWSLYQTLRLRTAGQMGDLVAGITAAVGSAGTLMVVAHSLGSALATYLTMDLADPARLGSRVSACLFASPQTGDSAFVERFDRSVANYRLYNYELDVVPRVPRGLGYATLPKATWISPFESQAAIRFDLGCHHHVICYCAMLDYTLLDWTKVPQQDQPCAACIRGPHA